MTVAMMESHTTDAEGGGCLVARDGRVLPLTCVRLTADAKDGTRPGTTSTHPGANRLSRLPGARDDSNRARSRGALVHLEAVLARIRRW